MHLLESLEWDPFKDADITAYCDASLIGIGFYFPASGVGYQSVPPTDAPAGLIFYFDAFCVAWCLHQIEFLHRINKNLSCRRITIWTDSKNTYDMFNSLRAKPLYNEILKFSIDILIRNDFQLRVLRLPGKKNVVADALSRWLNDDALAAYPELLIDSSQPLPDIPYYPPPRAALGATGK